MSTESIPGTQSRADHSAVRAPQSRKKRVFFSLVTGAIVVVVAAVVGELMVRVISPRVTLSPRLKPSQQYGLTLYENVQMVTELPGKWKFTYSVNSYGYRGKAVQVSNVYDRGNIVVLGDSYTFGCGVQDGSEYPAVMARRLNDRFQVVNLGVPGWGLTQEIRRFYEFGQLFDPDVVALQFSLNDPNENLTFMVTTVNGDEFVFRDCDDIEGTGIKKYLSHSFLQESQLYNLISEFEFRTRDEMMQKGKAFFADTSKIPADQRFYCALLGTFAEDLARRHVKFLMISVNHQLDAFPFIRAKIAALNAEAKLRYCEVDDWMNDVESMRSPEGHLWGEKAHLIIGNRLADIIETETF